MEPGDIVQAQEKLARSGLKTDPFKLGIWEGNGRIAVFNDNIRGGARLRRADGIRGQGEFGDYVQAKDIVTVCHGKSDCSFRGKKRFDFWGYRLMANGSIAIATAAIRRHILRIEPAFMCIVRQQAHSAVHSTVVVIGFWFFTFFVMNIFDS
jgi:hypothetical protein